MLVQNVTHGQNTFPPVGTVEINSININNRLWIQELAEANNERLVSLVTGQQRGIFVKDRNNMQGGLWLYGGGCCNPDPTDIATRSKGYVGAGLFGDGGTFIATSNAGSFIRFQEGNIDFYSSKNLSPGNIFYPTYGNPKMRFETNSAGAFLRLDGEMRANLVRVTQNIWADYVFDPNFKLRPLAEVENFINIHKHLPDVPDEKEIQNNGLNIGEMQKIQMQKIEELTLYIIEQNKQIQSLQEENKALLKRLEALENKKP